MRLFSLLASLLIVSACGSITQPGPVATPSQPDLQVVTDDVKEYTLGAGDKLRLIVFGEDDLSGEFLVDGSGIVSLPLVGEISVEGKTVREFQRSVETSLRDGYLNDPRVSAEVLNFRPFYILGEVNSPGTYPYSDSLTVLNAVAVAEGFTYRANQRVVFIRRDGETTEQQYPLSSTTSVRPGDTIRIAERIF
ncbi:polysaccharide biosynthesis/export family protein [Parvularcula sp. IMCC14364]|uniref:polysaccharide biosynthesis/export family protein n=1 Tax=Parvularcula sp. IMCC14364 TaxID=3067902 RepID=UPI0027413F56|nr:polysaccharide biosynthesis/export family protein [Parvularcula sp. IMCC14364]